MRRDQLNRSTHNTSTAAKTERPSSPHIIQGGRAFRAGGGGGNRKAYAKAAAGAGNTIVCFLDTDDTGDEITVTIEIANGSDLNEAFPVLSDGTLLTVWNDAGTWRNAGNPFIGNEDC